MQQPNYIHLTARLASLRSISHPDANPRLWFVYETYWRQKNVDLLSDLYLITTIVSMCSLQTVIPSKRKRDYQHVTALSSSDTHACHDVVITSQILYYLTLSRR